MLKLFAEISEFAGDLDDVEEKVERIYEKLIVSIFRSLLSFFLYFDAADDVIHQGRVFEEIM